MNQILTIFGFDSNKHSVKTEIMAGLTTFLTMSYILAVNPVILSAAGMDKGAVFSATIVASAIATLVMGIYAKKPFALASGMGVNAYFAYTLVLAMGYTWEQALAIVFLEGVIFIILTLFKVREAIVNSIPADLRISITVGIGLFIAYLGLKNGHVIVDDSNSLTTLGAWTATSMIAVGGILLGGILLAMKIRGALFYTILTMTVIGIPFGVTNLHDGFTLMSWPASMAPVAFHLDFSPILQFDIEFIIVAITLLFVDLFDTIGTLIGTCTAANMTDKNGEVKGLGKALMADAVGTTVGSLCGTSLVTTFVESTTGIMEGGRTGLTAFTVAILFLISLFFSPLFLIIPAAATTSALFLVGVMMMRVIRHINFEKMEIAIPCYITIIIMPLTGSISEGIVLGMLTYILIHLCIGEGRKLSGIMYVLGALFLLKYLIPLI